MNRFFSKEVPAVIKNNCIYSFTPQSVKHPAFCCSFSCTSRVLTYNQGGCTSTPRGKLNIVYKPYVKPCPMDHDYKNMSLKRPMSPHLQIYAPTLPAMTSIAQRITGVIVAAYALALAGGTLFLPNGIDTYISLLQSLNLSATTAGAVKFIAALPFAYHYFCGIRFCGYNMVKLLTLKECYQSAYVAIALSFALAAAFGFML